MITAPACTVMLCCNNVVVLMYVCINRMKTSKGLKPNHSSISCQHQLSRHHISGCGKMRDTAQELNYAYRNSAVLPLNYTTVQK